MSSSRSGTGVFFAAATGAAAFPPAGAAAAAAGAAPLPQLPPARHRRRGVCVKLFAWGEGDSGGHVLRETTSRGLSGLVCPSRTHDDPFIVLTETKFSICYIPVWARYSPFRTRVEAHAITLSP